MVSPAWWAAAVYVVFLGGFLLHLHYSQSSTLPLNTLIGATLLAWPVAGAIMFVGAIITGALALAPERSRGTMDALLMTPSDHEKLVRGRYWHGLAPWLRLFAYLLPIYILLSGTQFFQEASARSGHFWIISSVCSFSGKPVLTYLTIWEGWGNQGLDWHPWSVALLVLRLANDLSILLLAYAAAFHISARVRSSGRAMALACILVPVGLLTVFSLHDWMVAAILTAEKLHMDLPDNGTLTLFYCLLAAAIFQARWLLARWLARSACRNFDRWATDARAG